MASPLNDVNNVTNATNRVLNCIDCHNNNAVFGCCASDQLLSANGDLFMYRRWIIQRCTRFPLKMTVSYWA